MITFNPAFNTNTHVYTHMYIKQFKRKFLFKGIKKYKNQRKFILFNQEINEFSTTDMNLQNLNKYNKE